MVPVFRVTGSTFVLGEWISKINLGKIRKRGLMLKMPSDIQDNER